MATRSNRYFNNPAFAQVASNLAGMFAPPSAADTYAYERAASERAQAQRLSQLWDAAGGDFDRMGVASGQWNPNQSYYAVNTADATTRRGQDISAATSRANNTQDNQYRFATDRFNTPLSQGQTMPGMGADEIALLEGIGMDVPTDYVPGRTGLPKPLSSDEVLAQAIQDEMEATESFGSDLAYNELDVVKTLDPSGAPVYTPQGRAAMQGAPAYVDQGSRAAMQYKVYRTPDGRTGTAVMDPAGGVPVDAMSNEPLPQGTIFGDVAETGDTGLTTSTTSTLQKSLIDVDLAISTAHELRALREASPGTTGLLGMLRGTVQDVIATGNEMAVLMQGLSAETAEDMRGNVPSELREFMASNAFDPAIPAAHALTTLLAFQIAKTNTPGRVSNEAVQRIASSLGDSNWLASGPKSTSALDTYIGRLESQREYYKRRIAGENDALPGAPQTDAAQTGALPVVVSDGDYDALPPGATFVDENGQQFRKPAEGQ